MQPGEAILTGQVDGEKLGQVAVQLAPALPHESPIPFVPRGIAQRLWPGGFLPAAMAPAPSVAPAGIPAQPPAPVDAKGNSIARTQAMPQPAANQVARPQPAPQPTPQLTGYRSAAQGSEPIATRSQRVQIRERPGL